MIRDFKTFYFPLVFMPLVAAALTVWLCHRVFDDGILPLFGLIAIGLLLYCGWKDRAQMLCETEEDRGAFFWRLVRSYLVGALWILAGLVIAAVMLMDPPWLACVALPISLWQARIGLAAAKATPEGDSRHVRGRKLESMEEMKRKERRQLSEGEQTITWGGMKLPERAATEHFCVVGVTGTGKTLTLRLLMQEVLPHIRAGIDARAVIYDAKQDMASLLVGMRTTAPVILLNPFDARGFAWDMSADINDLGPAQEIAAILIPENKQENQPFFSDASRQILTYLMVALSRLCPKDKEWTFRDLILASDEHYLKPILSAVPEVWHRVKKYFDAKELPSILSTIVSRLARFEPVAAAWHHAEHRISLTAWAKEPSIIVLGTDPMFEFALAAVNQMLVKRLSQILLSQSESTTRRTWIFLDEFRSTGNLRGLSKLLAEGRSKGVCVALGFQDMSGLKDAYGDNIPSELTGQCNQKAFLRIEDPETAQWAAKCIGEHDLKERSESMSRGNSSGGPSWNHTVDERLATRPTVMPDEIRSLPPTNSQNGMSGYYTSPFYGAWKYIYAGKMLAETLLPPDHNVPNFVPRNAPQTIALWNEADLKRLNLDFLTPQALPAPRVTPVATTEKNPKGTNPPKHSLWSLGHVTPPAHRDPSDPAAEP